MKQKLHQICNHHQVVMHLSEPTLRGGKQRVNKLKVMLFAKETGYNYSSDAATHK